MLNKKRKNKSNAVVSELAVPDLLLPGVIVPERVIPEVTVQIAQTDNSFDITGRSAAVTGIEYACSSHIGTRENQQDYIDAGASVSGVVFGIVCDGMGGLSGGEVASSTAAQALAEALIKMDPNCDVPAFLTAQAHYVNKLVYDLPFESEGGIGAGTTIVAAVIVDKNLYWLSIGDSRIYIIRKNEIEIVTRDHSYSMELEGRVRDGRITAEDAASDPMRDALISYLGIDDLKIIDCNRNAFILKPGDIILLCSDGLYRSLCEADIMDVIQRHGDDIEECARVLPLYAYDKSAGSQDNTSVVLMRYQDGKPV